MPAFSNANDKTAIAAIRVKILFFLMKSIMLINNLSIRILLGLRIDKCIIWNTITITMAIYLGDIVC